MILTFFIDKTCEDCGEQYKGVQFDENRCPRCNQIHQLQRIADALEFWIGSL